MNENENIAGSENNGSFDVRESFEHALELTGMIGFE